MTAGQVATITIGSTTYNVYALTSDAVADATAYFAARVGADAWTEANTKGKQKALVSAARWLDRMSWQSVPVDVVTPQSMQHPRISLRDCNGTLVLDTDVGPGMAEAEFEMALILLDDAAAQEASGQGSNVKKAKAGSAEVEFFVQTIGTTSDQRLPQIAHDLVKCYLSGGGTIMIGSGSGDDGESAFCEDDFDRSQGFA